MNCTNESIVHIILILVLVHSKTSFLSFYTSHHCSRCPYYPNTPKTSAIIDSPFHYFLAYLSHPITSLYYLVVITQITHHTWYQTPHDALFTFFLNLYRQQFQHSLTVFLIYSPQNICSRTLRNAYRHQI